MHTTLCPVTRRNTPQEWTRPNGAEYTHLRRLYAHSQNPYSYSGSLDDPLADDPMDGWRIDWDVMTAEEARAWMARNTGCKGGRKYRRCQRCAPTP
ncbi:hypothetical protein ACWGCW_12830 [Streptomyces sp. NPDC054933]